VTEGWLRRRVTPARLLLASFLGLIAFGTLGLRLLPGLYTGEGLGWVDSLFTATSAVCVTGLIVVDTATRFTIAGQAFVLLLIQLGGLGIITFTTLIIQAFGGRISLHAEAAAASHTDVAPDLDLKRLVRSVVGFTLLFEGIGAAILFVLWKGRFAAGEAVWHAVFQSISAFCNAGFSTFSDSLVGFRSDPAALVTIAALIVAGGLGFLVLEELRYRAFATDRRSLARLSLHSRLVLWVTGILIVGGWAAFAWLEWNHSLGGLSVTDKAANSLFMSVTPRTAGFNTVDYTQTTVSSNFLTILLMSVGGSPGSTAGGIKTTTAALIALLAIARLRGRSLASVDRRSIPAITVQRAVGLFVVAFGIVTLGILVLAGVHLGGTEGSGHGRFMAIMFEAVSAFNTVGLSMGETPTLTQGGRILIVVLMYLGRVGPLSFAAAIATEKPPEHPEFRYAYEDVIVG
jgi:trk system potassium uptake protein TrkH